METVPEIIEAPPEATEQPTEKPAAKPVTAMAVDPVRQMIVVRDNGELLRLINTMMEAGTVPKCFNTPGKKIAAWQYAGALGVRPETAIPYLYMVNDRIAMWGELPKALAEATKQLTQFEVSWLDEGQNQIGLRQKNLEKEVWGVHILCQRADRKPNEFWFTKSDAEKAGLWGKAIWKQYPKTMLYRRTAAMALKTEFADAVLGDIAEYNFNTAPDLQSRTLKDVTPGGAAAEIIREYEGDDEMRESGE